MSMEPRLVLIEQRSSRLEKSVDDLTVDVRMLAADLNVHVNFIVQLHEVTKRLAMLVKDVEALRTEPDLPNSRGVEYMVAVSDGLDALVKMTGVMGVQIACLVRGRLQDSLYGFSSDGDGNCSDRRDAGITRRPPR